MEGRKQTMGRRNFSLETFLTRQLDTYSKLLRFLHLFRAKMDKYSGYSTTATELWLMYKYHCASLTSIDKDEVFAGVIRRLSSHDSRSVLALLCIRMNPAAFKPMFDQPVPKWTLSQLDYEFDYPPGGLSTGEGWICDGGECKFSSSGNIPSATCRP